jgi:hypothetical protein
MAPSARDEEFIREVQLVYAQKVGAAVERARVRAAELSEINRLSVLRGLERLESLFVLTYVGSVHIESFFGAAKTRPRWLARTLAENNIEKLAEFLGKPLLETEKTLKTAGIALPLMLKVLHGEYSNTHKLEDIQSASLGSENLVPLAFSFPSCSVE